jgi:2',3'-cyclic-nucleotide 2'-phosphodiesterase (5'-nucleotidase family)
MTNTTFEKAIFVTFIINTFIKMKKILFLLALFLTFTFSSLWAQTDTITILHMNDTHSGMMPSGPRGTDLKGTKGGIARAATVIGMTKFTEPKTLTLHAGDFAMGDIMYNVYFGVPELRILSQLGLDVMTLGNHEFDLTPAALLQTLDTAFASGGQFSILSANCVLTDSSVLPLKKYIESYTIKTVGTTKVGIFGLTTPETNLLSQPAPAFIDTTLAEIAYAMVDTLRKQGCQAVIMLSHLGYVLDSVIAQNIPGIDVIVGGHDHYVFSQPKLVKNPMGIDVPIVQVGAHYEYIGKMHLAVSGSTVSMLDYTVIPLDENVPEEPTIAGVLSELAAGVEAQYGKVYTQRLCTAHDDHDEIAEDLLSPGTHDTPVGNLVADAFRAMTGADVAIQVGGSTSNMLYKGEIVGADIYRMIGYGFNLDNGLGYRLATFKMSGAALAMGLEFGLSGIEHNDEFLVETSGMQYQYAVDAPPFSRLTGVLIGGAPLDTGKLYTVAANEFAVLFLSTIGIPISDVHIMSDTSEFQIVSAYAATQDTLRAKHEGRVSSIKLSVKNMDQFQRTGQINMSMYPNPSRDRAQLTLDIPEHSHIRIALFNSNGQNLRVLVDDMFQKGVVTIDVDTESLPSGNYQVMITDGERAVMRSLVISH